MSDNIPDSSDFVGVASYAVKVFAERSLRSTHSPANDPKSIDPEWVIFRLRPCNRVAAHPPSAVGLKRSLSGISNRLQYNSVIPKSNMFIVAAASSRQRRVIVTTDVMRRRQSIKDHLQDHQMACRCGVSQLQR